MIDLLPLFVICVCFKNVLSKFNDNATYSVPISNCTYLDFSQYTSCGIMMMDDTNSTAYWHKGYLNSVVAIDLLEPFERIVNSRNSMTLTSVFGAYVGNRTKMWFYRWAQFDLQKILIENPDVYPATAEMNQNLNNLNETSY